MAGTKVSELRVNLPIFVVWNPSTSFNGWTALHTVLSQTCSGTGNWTKIPSTELSSFNLCICLSISSCLVVWGSLIVLETMPK